MGDKATLRLARQELEDLYLGVPDDSVDLTFRDFAFNPAAAAAASGNPLPAVAEATTTIRSNLPHNAAAVADDDASVDAAAADGERNKKQTTAGAALSRSSTNIFTYRPLEDHEHAVAGGGGGSLAAGAAGGGGGGLLQLPPIPASPLTPTVRLPHSDDDDDDDDYADHQYHHHYPATAAAAGSRSAAAAAAARDQQAAAGGRRPRRSSHVADDAMGGSRDRRAPRSSNNYSRRPGIPHSNICALCNNYVYVFRNRCLVCGRVYCRRCAGAGMGDMTEGRKCIDCLGRRYSHRYIHRAGDTGACGFCCFWGNAKAVNAQELIWAEKGPAPRRRPRPHGLSSISASYGGGDGGYYSSTNTVTSASMSMTMNSVDSSITMMKMNGGHGRSISGMPASASSSFVAAFPNNPHALPL